jgi:hypothetical protein
LDVDLAADNVALRRVRRVTATGEDPHAALPPRRTTGDAEFHPQATGHAVGAPLQPAPLQADARRPGDAQSALELLRGERKAKAQRFRTGGVTGQDDLSNRDGE